AKKSSDIFFKPGAVATVYPWFTKFIDYMLPHVVHAEAIAVGRHSHTAPILYMITPGKIQVLVIQPPRGVDMHSTYSIFVVPVTINKIGHDGHPVGTGRVMDISAHNATAIAQSVGMGFGLGVQHNPGRFSGRRP